VLAELHLQDFVLFEQARLVFQPGLNAISGETGAGKSLVAQALGLALGQRATGDVIRAGAQEAVITALIRPRADAAPETPEAEAFRPDADGNVVIARHLRRDGRNRVSVNGRPVSLAAVTAWAQTVVDILAQNEHARLLEPAYQRQILDRFGRLDGEVAAFHGLFRRAHSLHRRLQATDAERARVQQRRADLRDLLHAIAAVRPDPEEDAGLEARIELLAHAQTVRALVDGGIQALYEEDGCVQDRVAHLARELEAWVEIHPPLAEAHGSLQAIQAHLETAVHGLRDALDAVSGEAGGLEAAIERAEALKRVARRAACAPGELAARAEVLGQELAELDGWETDEDEIRKELEAGCRTLAAAGLQISRQRQQAAQRLARTVNDELKGLGMETAGFHVTFTPRWHEGDGQEALLADGNDTGLDALAFALSPNPGEQPSSLAEAASGGECGRTMLALRSALAEIYAPPVLFLDEVDTGLGARLGDAVANALRRLATTRQVIVITHLAQVAASADAHQRVTKQVHRGRTTAQVEALAGSARLEEVAQMIRGEAATPTTKRQAAEMLAQHQPESRQKRLERQRRAD